MQVGIASVGGQIKRLTAAVHMYGVGRACVDVPHVYLLSHVYDVLYLI